MTHWAVLQLRDQTDPLVVTDLERDFWARCPGAVFKFPATKQGALDRDNPLSAYVFVQAPASTKLETSPYALRFLRDPASRRLQNVPDHELQSMIAPPDLPPVQTIVRATAGDWVDMEGVVVSVNCERVGVLFELWSKKAVVDLSPNEFVVL